MPEIMPWLAQHNTHPVIGELDDHTNLSIAAAVESYSAQSDR